jgi:DNA repair ATPase RecN
MSDDQFKAAIKAKLIQPTVTREDIDEFKKGEVHEGKSIAKATNDQVRLVTISLDKTMNQSEIAKEILEEVVDKVEDLRQLFKMYNIHMIDHGLVEQLETLNNSNEEAMKRAFDGIAQSQEATLRLLARIAKAIARSRKKFASPSERKNVKKGFMVRSWGMEEVYKCEPTREGIETAFGELDVALDIDQCIAKPQLARDYYQKVLSAQDNGIKW